MSEVTVMKVIDAGEQKHTPHLKCERVVSDMDDAMTGVSTLRDFGLPGIQQLINMMLDCCLRGQYTAYP